METCTVLEYSNSCTTKLASKLLGVIHLQVVMCIHTIVSVSDEHGCDDCGGSNTGHSAGA